MSTENLLWDYNDIPQSELEETLNQVKDILPFEPRYRQLQSIKAFKDGHSVLACLCTSYGKTPIAVISALDVVKRGKIVILLVPLKALGQEHKTTFEKFGLSVNIFDSDNDFDMEKTPLANVNIFTYEKFDSLLRKKKYYYILKNVELLIIDEIHNINVKSGRGYPIESAIIKVKIINKEIKFLGLSATVEEEERLAKFLNNAKIIKTNDDERPVPLQISVKIVEKEHAPSELLDDLSDGINTLTFTSSRKRAEQLAYSKNGENAPLPELIKNGIGFHHAGIDGEDAETGEIIQNKKMVEDSYRKGLINYLFSTPTLAAGVNLPAKRVIVFDTVRYSTLHGEVAIDHAEILQMVGRAGRNPKVDKIAYASLYVPEKYYSYFNAELRPPAIKSNFTLDGYLIVFILELIAEELANNAKDIILTLLKYKMEKVETERIAECIKFLLNNKLIYQEGMTLKATFVGRMCIMLYIHPKTAIHLRDCYVPVDNLAQKFFATLNTPEFTDNVTVRDEDSQNIALVYRYLKNLNVNIDNYKYRKELCKSFALLFRRELIRYFTEELKEPEPKIYYSSADTMILKKAATRLFTAGTIIGNQTIKTECKFLTKTISAQRFDKDLALLMQVPNIGDTRLTRLMKAKINTIQKFIDEDNNNLVTILGRVSTDAVLKMKESANKILAENIK